MPEHWVCPECGPHVAADEDGCCATCGAEASGEPCGGHVCGDAMNRLHKALREILACCGKDKRLETIRRIAEEALKP